MNASWILVAEITLPLLAFIIFLGLLVIKRRRAADEGCKALLEEVKASETAQTTALMRFLTETLLHSESEAKQTAEAVILHRKLLLKKIMEAQLSPNVTAIKSLSLSISAVTDEYHKLVPALAPAQSADSAQGGGGSADELNAMREENERLKKEVQITLSTLNNIFAEYSSMFGDEKEQRDMGVDDILSSMENMMGSVEGELEPGQADDLAKGSGAETASGDGEDSDDISWDAAFAEAAQSDHQDKKN